MNHFEGTWLPNENRPIQTTFEKVCQTIVLSELTDFKRNPKYASIVGNDLRDEKTARAFYDYIESNYLYLLSFLNLFSENDILGSPMLYNIDGHIVSPGTLRFIKVLGDLRKIKTDISSIVEIGAGYGGQCLITKLYDPEVSYTMVDIPASSNLAKKYLGKRNLDNVHFVSTENVNLKGIFDICISDYCLSELDEVGVLFYLDNVLSKCRSAYITTNSLGLSLKDLVNLLFTIYHDITVQKENPKTSNHDNWIIICKNNRLL